MLFPSQLKWGKIKFYVFFFFFLHTYDITNINFSATEALLKLPSRHLNEKNEAVIL